MLARSGVQSALAPVLPQRENESQEKLQTIRHSHLKCTNAKPRPSSGLFMLRGMPTWVTSP